MMRIYRGLDDIETLHNPVVAIGSFDGVHLGHRQILHYLCQYAHQLNGESVVITFHPHPQQVLHPQSDFFMINSLEDNLKLIEKQGVNATIILPFTLQFSKLSFTEFLEDIIIRKIHVKALVMGPNHSFGHNREGNLRSIEEFCIGHGVQVAEIPELMVHEAGVRSAKIRKLIQAKNWPEVDMLLGYSYVNKTNK